MFRSWSWRMAGALALSIALMGVVGCGGRKAVTGEVRFNGQPVDGGRIVFIHDNGTRASGDIAGGNYAFSAKEGPASGKNRVEIVWPKKTGKTVEVKGDPGNKTDETTQVIPAKYNRDSTLSVDVKSGGVYDFTLTQ